MALRRLLQSVIDPALFAGARGLSAVQRALGVDPPGRALSARERAELQRIFYDSLDLEPIRVAEGVGGLFAIPPRVAAFVVGNVIFVTRRAVEPGEPLELGLLVHEAVHVWQYQHGGLRYLSEALGAQLFGDAYDFEKGHAAGKAWRQLNPEQQAELIQQAYLAGFFHHARRFVFRGVELTDWLERALLELRAGRGAPG